MRTTVRLLALLFGLVLAGAAVPAQAASQLGLSTDGVHWKAQLPDLFSASMVWVPGDSETAAFYVRNQSDDMAVMGVDLVGGVDESLMTSGDLAVSAKVDGGSFHAVALTGTHPLIQGVATGPGKVHKVTVRVDFAGASLNPTQRQRFDFRFDVHLTQAAGTGTGGVGGAGSSGTGSSGTGSSGSGASGSGGSGATGAGGAGGSGLPNTGAEISPLAIYLALGLCAGGTALIVRSRRRPASTLERQS